MCAPSDLKFLFPNFKRLNISFVKFRFRAFEVLKTSKGTVFFRRYRKCSLHYSDSDSELDSSDSSSSSSSSLSVSSIIWNFFLGKNILYPSMSLMSIRASSYPSKLLDKPHFVNECLIKSFLFLYMVPRLAYPFCSQDTSPLL